jgi:colanic acid biosynthesis glycosyl transferase WcaI
MSSPKDGMAIASLRGVGPAPAVASGPTLLIMSQVYVPDPAAVGQHVADAAEEMARRGWRVVVYAANRGYEDPSICYPGKECRKGVDVRRLPLSSFGKSSIAIRLIAQMLFLTQATVRGLFTRRLGAVLVSTSPPMAGIAGAVISKLRGVPLLWWVMDLNPDQLVAAGRIASSSLFVRLFDWMNRVTLRQATTVVVLDRFMKDRVVAKAPVRQKIEIIPPWPHDDDLTAPSPGSAAFRATHCLQDKFVVMYSGNHSPHNPLDTLLAASQRLAEDDRIRFVFIGGGAAKGDVDRLVAAGARNVVTLPYQPKHALGSTLAAADIHVVSIGDGMVGIIHPCKIYGAMAIGRPILLFGPPSCHAADIMQGDILGWHVPHGDLEGTIRAIHAASQLDANRLQDIGDRCQAIATRQFSRQALLTRFCDLLQPACKR